MIIAEVQKEIGFWISSPSLLRKGILSSFWVTSPLPFPPCWEPSDRYLLPNSKKQVKKYWYQKNQRFRKRLQRWMVREVLNPLREMFLSFPTLEKVPSCPPTCLCKHLAKMMIYQLLSNLELSVSWGRMPSAQYNNKVLHLTAKSLDTAAFQHSRLENVLQLCINWKGGERGKKKKKKCNELNMEMNNTLKYNLLCVILVFNSIYFMFSLHDGLAQIYV